MSENNSRTSRTDFFLGGKQKRKELEEVLAQPESCACGSCSCPDCNCDPECATDHSACGDPECGFDPLSPLGIANRQVFEDSATSTNAAREAVGSTNYTSQGGCVYAWSWTGHTAAMVLPWVGG